MIEVHISILILTYVVQAAAVYAIAYRWGKEDSGGNE